MYIKLYADVRAEFIDVEKRICLINRNCTKIKGVQFGRFSFFDFQDQPLVEKHWYYYNWYFKRKAINFSDSILGGIKSYYYRETVKKHTNSH